MSHSNATASQPVTGTPAAAEAATPRRALAGLFIRRECWSLSTRGKILLLILGLLSVVGLGRGLYPFLAVTHRTSNEMLVLEGWIPAYVVNQVAQQVKSEDYGLVIMARPLYAGTTEFESGEASAKYVAENLVNRGIPREHVHVVFSESSDRDRTYRSALSVKKWLEERGLSIHTLDVGTVGPHARRSRLLFQRAFGKDVKVGVIAFQDQDYDPAHWWRYSAGVREVPFELIAYLYVKLLFSPD